MKIAPKSQMPVRYIVYTFSPESYGEPIAIYDTLEPAMTKYGHDCYVKIKLARWDGIGLIPKIKDAKFLTE